MALEWWEERSLQEMEAALRQDDPGLETRMRRTDSRRSRQWLWGCALLSWAVVLSFVEGVGESAVDIVAWLVMGASLWCLVRAMDLGASPDSAELQRPRPPRQRGQS